MTDNGDTNRPFFSVITITYDRAHLIARAIDSLLAQSFRDWELIVIDDGSTDNTLQVIAPYLSNDVRIRYYRTENQGPALARNEGILRSKGQYITFLDSDDEYLSEHLSSRSDILARDASVDMLHGGMEIIGDEYVADRNDTTKLVHLSECFAGGTFVIRHELALRLQGFRDLEYGDDSDFAQRAIASGAIVIKCELPTYRYYRGLEDSICTLAANGGLQAIRQHRYSTRGQN